MLRQRLSCRSLFQGVDVPVSSLRCLSTPKQQPFPHRTLSISSRRPLSISHTQRAKLNQDHVNTRNRTGVSTSSLFVPIPVQQSLLTCRSAQALLPLLWPFLSRLRRRCILVLYIRERSITTEARPRRCQGLWPTQNRWRVRAGRSAWEAFLW